jgi:hypothetical protein
MITGNQNTHKLLIRGFETCAGLKHTPLQNTTSQHTPPLLLLLVLLLLVVVPFDTHLVQVQC